jgi:hypothetical protein
MSVKSAVVVAILGLCLLLSGCLHNDGKPFVPYHPAWAEK